MLLLAALIAVSVGFLAWCVMTPTRNYNVDLHRRHRDRTTMGGNDRERRRRETYARREAG